MKDLISVVVPIYKVEEYLEKCVESIINQTYTNLEIFLVDDGSPDNCGKICDEYAKKDSRIKVIHKKNGGLSDARNAAIDIATGKYIIFIDSDDYVALDMIEFLYNTLKRNKAEISTCLFIPFDTEEPNEDKSENEELVYSSEQALENMLYQKNCTTSAWAKLYLTSFFKDIRYPFGKICEDLDTTYKLFGKAKKIVINTQKKYYYLQRATSIINSKFNLKRMDALTFAIDQAKFIEKNYPNIKKAGINRLFVEAIFILNQIPFKKEFKNERKKLYQVIKDNRRVVLTDKNSRTLYRLYALISYLGGSTLTALLHFKSKIRRK